MKVYTRVAAAAALLVGVAACHGDFLSGGDLSNDPNVASTATAQNIFVGTQTALWTELGSDMSRVTMIWAQQLIGNNQQYVNIDQYGNSEQVTNGFHEGIYITGGLVDMRKLQAKARAANDSLFTGIAQVEEAWIMGEGADLFGDLVYSEALKNTPNPTLDPQQTVYAHVIALLDSAIANMAATGSTNIGPGDADLAYGGDPVKWTQLAHTLKARFYLHQTNAPWTTPAQVAALALADAQLGLQSGNDYNANFSGAANEQNFWYQFVGPAGRAGYYVPADTFAATLVARGGQPYELKYFQLDQGNLVDLSADRLNPNSPQTFASYVENELLWAEAAYRTGAILTAQTHLQNALTTLGETNPARAASETGTTLLHDILVTKWIADFQLGTEAYTDYRRTCVPNLRPTVPNGHVPMRLFYDSNERNTNTNIPQPGTAPNGFFNTGQPSRATSEEGGACLAQG